MKLRNKKTGVIVEVDHLDTDSDGKIILVNIDDQVKWHEYASLAELNSEWEDAPEEPKKWYWFIEDNSIIQRSCHYEDLHPTLDKSRKEIGNYFETREEAEKAVEKLKAIKRLKDKGFRFLSNKTIGEYGSISYCLTYPATSEEDKDLDLLFGGEE